MKRGGGAEPFFRLQIGSALCSLERNLPLPIALFLHLSPPLSVSMSPFLSPHLSFPPFYPLSPPSPQFFLPSSLLILPPLFFVYREMISIQSSTFSSPFPSIHPSPSVLTLFLFSSSLALLLLPFLSPLPPPPLWTFLSLS